MSVQLMTEIQMRIDKKKEEHFFGSETVEINFIDGKIRNANFIEKISKRYEK